MAKPTTSSIVVILLLFAFGCSTFVQKDDTIPAVDANYPNAEFYGCGKHFDGLGICTIKAGDDFSSLAISIQGYHEGQISFDTNCVTKNVTPQLVEYSNSNRVSFPMAGRAMSSCGITFKIQPKIPSRSMKPYEGQLYVRVIPHDITFLGITMKVPTGVDPVDIIKIPTNDATANVVLESGLCGIKFDEEIIAQNGFLPIRLRVVLPVVEQKTCIVSGAVLFSQYVLRVTWLIAGYDSHFKVLSKPLLRQTGDNIRIEGDNSVSVTALDANYNIDNYGTFKFDPNYPHTLRLLTASGRVLIGDYFPDRDWEWIY